MTTLLDRDAVAGLLKRPALQRLLPVLDGNGEETRIVGGAIRNALIGRPVHEVDLATTATPRTTTKRAQGAGFKVVPTGIEHGTVTVIVDGAPFEVTTLREDVETDGRRAVVRFGRDFGADARRRDFTINALSLTPDGRVHDEVGGLDDLAAGQVRFIGDPVARIREDYLRILRFFRFHAGYGEGPLDRAGLDAAIRERAGLAILSRERIRTEILKLLAARGAAEVTAAMTQAGFLTLLLGVVGEFGRLTRSRGTAHREASDPVLPLAALAVTTVEDSERLRVDLRLSNAEEEYLAAYARLVARLKSVPEPLDERAIRCLAVEHGAALLADALSVLDGEPRPVTTPASLTAAKRFADGDEPVPVFPLRGADLVALGVEKGPQVGRLLAEARQAWIALGCPSDATIGQLLPGLNADSRGG